jgi:crotonobetainyl-CoA:carnitine CoA-transferase CaiB-like acyl-CoA transferase
VGGGRERLLHLHQPQQARHRARLPLERPREALKRLVQDADVVIENFRVGTMEKWGLGYEEVLRPLNPRLVYCSITGYGRSGPAAHLPGYDPIIEAVGGFMAINGEEGGRPLKVGVAVIDELTGCQAAFAITAALLHRDRTGEGQRVDLSLFESGCRRSPTRPPRT